MVGAPASTENANTTESRPAAPARPYLFVFARGARPPGAARPHAPAELAAIVVGRGASRAAWRGLDGARRRLELRFPGATVSSVHARIERSEGGWAGCE